MSKSILVVEDQEDNRQIIRNMLSATDYEIRAASRHSKPLRSPTRPPLRAFAHHLLRCDPKSIDIGCSINQSIDH